VHHPLSKCRIILFYVLTLAAFGLVRRQRMHRRGQRRRVWPRNMPPSTVGAIGSQFAYLVLCALSSVVARVVVVVNTSDPPIRRISRSRWKRTRIGTQCFRRRERGRGRGVWKSWGRRRGRWTRRCRKIRRWRPWFGYLWWWSGHSRQADTCLVATGTVVHVRERTFTL
jgi:hypothetical protein